MKFPVISIVAIRKMLCRFIPLDDRRAVSVFEHTHLDAHPSINIQHTASIYVFFKKENIISGGLVHPVPVSIYQQQQLFKKIYYSRFFSYMYIQMRCCCLIMSITSDARILFCVSRRLNTCLFFFAHFSLKDKQ